MHILILQTFRRKEKKS